MRLNTGFTYESGYPCAHSYTVYDQQGKYNKWIQVSPN